MSVVVEIPLEILLTKTEDEIVEMYARMLFGNYAEEVLKAVEKTEQEEE